MPPLPPPVQTMQGMAAGRLRLCSQWSSHLAQPLRRNACIIETGALGDQRAQCKGPANTGGGEGSEVQQAGGSSAELAVAVAGVKI